MQINNGVCSMDPVHWQHHVNLFHNTCLKTAAVQDISCLVLRWTFCLPLTVQANLSEPSTGCPCLFVLPYFQSSIMKAALVPVKIVPENPQAFNVLTSRSPCVWNTPAVPGPMLAIDPAASVLCFLSEPLCQRHACCGHMPVTFGPRMLQLGA